MLDASKIRLQRGAEDESHLFAGKEIPHSFLNDLDVLGFGAFGCLFDLEANPLSFR